MKNKKSVRIGAASLTISAVQKKTGNRHEMLFDFCETWLPGCGCDVVLLPEGPDPRDGGVQSLIGSIARAYGSLAREHRLYLIAPLALKGPKGHYNAVVVYSPTGKAIHTSCKVHLAPSEKGSTLPGPGFSVFRLPWFTGGIMTCFDNQFPESSRILAVLGAQMVFLPSFGDLDKPHRDAARCLDSHIYLTGASFIDTGCGIPASRFEQGKIMDPLGRTVVSTGPRTGLAVADLPLKNGKLVTQTSQNSIGFEVNYLKLRRPEAYRPLVR